MRFTRLLLQSFRDGEDNLSNSRSAFDMLMHGPKALRTEDLPLRDNVLKSTLVDQLRYFREDPALSLEVVAGKATGEHELVVQGQRLQESRARPVERLQSRNNRADLAPSAHDRDKLSNRIVGFVADERQRRCEAELLYLRACHPVSEKLNEVRNHHTQVLAVINDMGRAVAFHPVNRLRPRSRGNDVLDPKDLCGP
jgi:hypothetical protein